MSTAASGERRVPLPHALPMFNLFPRGLHRACLEAGTRQTLFGAGLKDFFQRGIEGHSARSGCLLGASSRI